MLNSLDSDQNQHIVRPGIGSNCLQRLSADDTRRYIVKEGKLFIISRQGLFPSCTSWARNYNASLKLSKT